MKLTVKEKILFIFLIIFMICGFGFGLIKNYKYSKLTSDSLENLSVTYIDYTESKGSYKINTSEKTFILDSSLITQEELDSIKEETILEIGCYKNQIMVLVVDNEKIISLDSSISNVKKEMRNGIFVYIGIIIFILLIYFVMTFINNKLLDPANYTYTKVKFKEEIHYTAYQKMRDSFVKKGPFYYCDILEYYETDELNYTLYKLMVDYIDEDKIYLFIDNGENNEGFAWVAYRLENKLLFDIVYKNNETNKYELSIDLFYFYPDEEATLAEQEMYTDALDLFVSENVDKVSILV